MYNPLPHLPKGFQRKINSLKSKNIHSRLIFILLGVMATTWFLIRVIPKPSRAAYPCMQATAPFMSAFVIYLFSLGGTVVAARSVNSNIKRSRYSSAFVYLILCGFLLFFSQSQVPDTSFANMMLISGDNFTPNEPIGEAQGIFPGRVVWMWDPDATNENCANTSNNNGGIDAGDNAWFMDFNNNLPVIDSMITKSLLAISGQANHAEAWDAIFRFYNSKNAFGNLGYQTGQKIFLKINATSAYGNAGVNYFSDLSRNDNIEQNKFASETNPYLVLALIDQLVNVAHIPEDMIYVGDPARNIYKWIYEYWFSEFPGVNYLGNDLIHPDLNVAEKGRIPVEITEDDKVFFSDNGEVMPDAVSDKLFTIFEEVDYLINIPTIKAHSSAGITLAAKNHFGSFTRTWAMHMHPGLIKNGDSPGRYGYGLYRVQTDIMMHKLLSGKNLLMMVDGLYPGEDALGVPFKWESAPFNNDWCSSIFMSLDPVAIESVCHDFLRTEYNGPTLDESRPNWDGVDDYLHQAADSALWPVNVVYDPDDDGILIASLGVHEHWNNSVNKQYTRNLGTGSGIELIKVHEGILGVNQKDIYDRITVYPNPSSDFIVISNKKNEEVSYSIMDMHAKVLVTGKLEAHTSDNLKLTSYPDGIYNIIFTYSDGNQVAKIIKR